MLHHKLQISLSGITLANPIIPASGTYGFGDEFAELYDINCLGGISFKGTTREARYGNPLPRIAECGNYGMINAVGLQNPGVEHVIAHELPRLKSHYNGCIVANVSGFSVQDYVETCALLDKEPIDILEVNISCPNVHNGGMAFGTSPEAAAEVTAAVKAVTTKPVYMKLSPNVTDIVAIAKACEAAGADGLCLINTVLGMRIDIRNRRPILHNNVGGLSGPAIFPVAVRCVWQCYNAVKIPIIGMGGISTWEDAVEMMLAGASAIQMGTAIFTDPYAPLKVIDGLEKYMDDNGIKSLSEIVGQVKPW